MRATDVDDRDRVTVVGSFGGATTVNFGGGLRPISVASGFIARYTTESRYVFDTVFGTQGQSSGVDVAVGPGDATVVVGSFTGIADFGSGFRVSLNASDAEPVSDAFVARLSD